MTVRALSVDEAKQLVDKGGVEIVDVREPKEWALGHLPGARLVPLAELRANPKDHLGKDGVLFVCARGGRSLTAAKLAEKNGLAEIYSLDGGTDAWQKAGLPIEIPPEAPSPTARPEDPVPEPVIEAGEPPIDAVVGENLRELRARGGLTLDDLARKTGLSRSLLGQVELGRSAPSVSVVWKIARAFDVPFSALLSTRETVTTRVMRKKRAKRLVSADGRFASRALFPSGQEVEFYELRLAAHSREEAEPHQAGTRENLVVVSGKLALQVGAERFDLDEGDAILFAADVPHTYTNPGGTECVMHLVMTYQHHPRQ